MLIAASTALSGPRLWQLHSLRDSTVAPPCCHCLLSRGQRSHQPRALQTEPTRQRTVLLQTPGTNASISIITYPTSIETLVAAAGRSAAASDFWRHRLIVSSKLAHNAFPSWPVKCSRDNKSYRSEVYLSTLTPGLQSCCQVAWP